MLNCGRQLDRHEQSKDSRPGTKRYTRYTGAESPGFLAIGKTGKRRTLPPG